MATQAQRSAETRLAINEATIRCLIERGYAGTTTLAVQQSAGVSRGAITHHFATKQEMVFSAIDYLSSIFERVGAEAVIDLPEGPDRIHAAVEMMWTMFKSDLFYAELELWVASRTDRELHEALYAAERRLGHRHERWIAEILGESVAARSDFRQVVEMIRRQLRGAALARLMRRQPDTEDSVVDSVTDYVLAVIEADASHRSVGMRPGP